MVGKFRVLIFSSHIFQSSLSLQIFNLFVLCILNKIKMHSTKTSKIQNVRRWAFQPEKQRNRGDRTIILTFTRCIKKYYQERKWTKRVCARLNGYIVKIERSKNTLRLLRVYTNNWSYYFFKTKRKTQSHVLSLVIYGLMHFLLDCIGYVFEFWVRFWFAKLLPPSHSSLFSVHNLSIYESPYQGHCFFG